MLCNISYILGYMYIYIVGFVLDSAVGRSMLLKLYIYIYIQVERVPRIIHTILRSLIFVIIAFAIAIAIAIAFPYC
mgnify:CR=1 FL=1